MVDFLLPGASLLDGALKNLGDRERRRRDRVADYLVKLADIAKEMVRTMKEDGEPPTAAGNTFKHLVDRLPNVMFEIYSARNADDKAQVDQLVAGFRQIHALSLDIDVTLAAREAQRRRGRALDAVAWRNATYRMIRDRVRQIERDMAGVEAFAAYLRATSP
jgi:hypothetical protein